MIKCPRCNKEPDLPLYCNECDSFYCINCHQQHLIDFLPHYETPKHIQDKVMKDMLEIIGRKNE